MSRNTTKLAPAAAIAAAASMTTPAQLERLGEHLRKLRLLKIGERLEALLQQAAALRGVPRATAQRGGRHQHEQEYRHAHGDGAAPVRQAAENVRLRLPTFDRSQATAGLGQLPTSSSTATTSSSWAARRRQDALGGQPRPEGHRAGYRVLFTTAASLIEKLTKARAEGRLEDKLKLYTAPRLLIIDEIGYLPIDRVGANVVFRSSAGATSAGR
jgi:hypothetical protein